MFDPRQLVRTGMRPRDTSVSVARSRRRFLCGLSLAVLSTVAGRSLAQEEEDWSKIQLKATKVATGIYMIDMVEGSGGFAGGNIGVSVGADGIVMVDDMFAPLAPKILEVLKKLSDKPVRFVVNTHVHADHCDGNSAFGASATIIAHANTRQQLSTAGPDPDDKAVPAIALPSITVEDRITLHQNGEDIRIVHFPNAHSDTDVVVFFERGNVVHMGDMYFAGMFPFIGRGGSVKGLIAGIDSVLNEIPSTARIIPGHGPLSTTAELRSTLAMLRETSAIIESGIASKKSLEQLTSEKVLAKYDRWAAGYINTDQYLEQMYKALSR